jgi:glycogen(starch) synthase
MTRVLTITSLYPPHHLGGAELSCYDVMTRLTERGHDVKVLCADARLPGVADPPGEEQVERRLRVYLRDGEPYAPSMPDRVAIERNNQAVLEDVIERHRPDVASVWHMGAMSLGLLATLGRLRVPIVYSVCDEWPAYETKLDPWARLWWGSWWRRAAGTLVARASGVPTLVGDLGATGAFLWVSDSVRRRVEANTPWTYRCSSVVYSGIDTRAFPLVEDGEGRSWAWRLLYAGRFDERKGVETAVRALAHLPDGATLRLCGQGAPDQRRHLEEVGRSLGVSDRVRFEALDREALATAYRDSDVFVFPSLWEEPFGLVPVEAMACGTPVVGTGTGGSAEFLRDGSNFLRFPPGDAGALAACVRRLAAEPDLRSRLVTAGLATSRRLDVSRLADVFEAWHAAAADRFASGRPPDRQPIRSGPGAPT